MIKQIVRGPLLIPLDNGGVNYHPDGALAVDERGMIAFAGEWKAIERQLTRDTPKPRTTKCVIIPPLLDLHTHIPQHPIRGNFCDGVGGDEPGGRLLAALTRNVFPAEARCSDDIFARRVIEAFANDVLANGVVGGAAFMTVSATATELALEILPPAWSVGLVLMNQNCPANLRTD
jgi:cytosine/adenosine deaminase-related metal-dependent hydrolase